MSRSRIREGSLVRLRGKKRATRVVSLFRTDETSRKDGVRLLEPLNHFRYWNISDLEVVPREERK